ncbi:unnamed protein product [Choristocarpus tenellus]
MVAVYLDDKSVETLHALYPEARVARLRKVVLQYNPTNEERNMYEPLFGGNATVKVLGEATSSGNHALTASVWYAGGRVKSHSLSPAIDLAEEAESGGPLACAALAKQTKRAGATKQSSWTGELPALTAYNRHFPAAEGKYEKLKKPIKLTGSICRADWVDGPSAKCRVPVTEEELDERRKWEPSGCHLCNTLRGSPCHDIFRRWEALSELVTKSEKWKQEVEEGGNVDNSGSEEEEVMEDNDSSDVEGGDGKDGRNGAVSEKDSLAATASRTSEETEGSKVGAGEGQAGEGGGGETGAGGGGTGEVDVIEDPEAEERYRKLMDDMVAATMEMRDCIDYHDVFAEVEADMGS